MKKILLLLTILMLNLSVYANDKKTYERLIHAISYVESKHNPKLVSPNGKYVGYLQIAKCCVDACNNILGKKKYTYNDRYDKEKSIEMFHIIQNKYNPQQDIIIACRIWSEGISALRKPYGHTRYSRKVMKIYNNSDLME